MSTPLEPPTSPSNPAGRPGVIAARLTLARGPRQPGAWTLHIGPDRLTLVDPAGKTSADLGLEEAARTVRLPGHFATGGTVRLPVGGSQAPFDFDGPGFEQLEAFIQRGMVAAGPVVRRRVLWRAFRDLIVGTLSLTAGAVITAISQNAAAKNGGSYTIMTGAIIVGIVEVARAVAGFVEYGKLSRAVAVPPGSPVIPRCVPAGGAASVPRVSPHPVRPNPPPIATPAMRAGPARVASPVPRVPAVPPRPIAEPATPLSVVAPATNSPASMGFRTKVLVVLGATLALIAAVVIWGSLTQPLQRPAARPSPLPVQPTAVAQAPPSGSVATAPPEVHTPNPQPAPTQAAAPPSSSEPIAPNPTPASSPSPPPAPSQPPPMQIVLSGAIEWAESAPSLKPGGLVSRTMIRLIRERQKLSLSAPLECDATSTGTWSDSLRRATARAIPAGTVISGFMLHVNIPGSGVVNLSGSITFPGPILGIIASNGRLDASDSVVGNAATAYPTGGQFRQWFDGDQGDFITVSADRHTLSVRSHTGKWIDQIRVITAAEP